MGGGLPFNPRAKEHAKVDSMMDKPRLTTSTLANHNIHLTTLMFQLGYKLTSLSSALGTVVATINK